MKKKWNGKVTSLALTLSLALATVVIPGVANAGDYTVGKNGDVCKETSLDMRLEFPANTFKAKGQIKIKPVDIAKIAPNDRFYVTRVIDANFNNAAGNYVASLEKPMRVIFNISDIDFARASQMKTDLPIGRFHVGYWNEGEKNWDLLSSRIFWDGHYGAVEAETGHASGTYALLWCNQDESLSPVMDNAIRVAVDYELLNAQPAPYSKDGRTMVPLRLVAEKLKADINWTGSEQRIDLVRGLDTVQLWVGKTDVVKNKKPLTVSDPSTIVAPEIVDGTTYVPLRLISEAFGVKIDWDGVTKTVYINNF
ncbi:hypothetical protein GTO89_08525 [Heliobacterium gestii]|uniref:Copper amine oxidase-like N-terminal domain-containing protein n=1 Tax=Heliomicrobium gestii TaxID=2699 RepID=A0A845LDS3_HELGE|nr:copper amine oxidase N-terminal domain-containing protein [Heliomicrobium gestii]MBM7866640.1 hypothetical protein [Heliomicrobium gestii]MZP43080.1 hypothetical protein [Heliomicrobium gestii]